MKNKFEGVSKNMVTELVSLLEIADQYDVFFIDLWGVTHNGIAPFQNAIAVYRKLKEMGKTLIVLSNAPRLPEITRKRLSDMGIDSTLFDGIMTSGVECHEALRDRNNPFYAKLGTKLFHIGPERDRTVFEGLPYIVVDTVEESDFLLITGTDGWEKTTDAYDDRLVRAHSHNLPAVCANADKVVQHGNDLVICAGAIAEAYRAMGAENIYVHGKPNSDVYAAAHRLANIVRGSDVPLSRILMLGDSLATDIRGANLYGIDSVFTLSGVHSGVETHMWFDLFKDYQAHPTFIMVDGIA